MRNVLLVFLVLTAFQSSAQRDEKNMPATFDSIVFYDYNDDRGSKDNRIIDHAGKLDNSVKKSFRADPALAAKLNEMLKRKDSFGVTGASCFEPHLGIVYYLDGKPISSINVCMDCNRLYADFRIKAQEQGKNGKGENTYYVLNGMSGKLRDFLNEQLILHNFSHQAEKYNE